jgi:hypothetical protein
MPYLCTLA